MTVGFEKNMWILMSDCLGPRFSFGGCCIMADIIRKELISAYQRIIDDFIIIRQYFFHIANVCATNPIRAIAFQDNCIFQEALLHTAKFCNVLAVNIIVHAPRPDHDHIIGSLLRSGHNLLVGNPTVSRMIISPRPNTSVLKQRGMIKRTASDQNRIFQSS